MGRACAFTLCSVCPLCWDRGGKRESYMTALWLDLWGPQEPSFLLASESFLILTSGCCESHRKEAPSASTLSLVSWDSAPWLALRASVCSPVQWDSNGFHLTGWLWGSEPLPRDAWYTVPLGRASSWSPYVPRCVSVETKATQLPLGHWLFSSKGIHSLEAGLAPSDFSGPSSRPRC